METITFLISTKMLRVQCGILPECCSEIVNQRRAGKATAIILSCSVLEYCTGHPASEASKSTTSDT